MLTIILIFSILFSTAYAEQKVFFDEQFVLSEFGKYIFVEDVCFVDEKVYILVQNQIYLYRVGDEKPVHLITFVENQERELLRFDNYAKAKESIGEKAEQLMNHLFYWNETLYGINELTGDAIGINTKKL